MSIAPLARVAGRMSLRAAGIATFAFLGLLALLISSAKATAGVPPGWSSTIGTGTNVCAPGPGADCSGVQHKWEFRHGGDLSQSDFSRAHLHGAKLHGANLQEANFSKAKLHRAKFHGADLTDAVFVGAKAKGAKFHGAVLKNVSFRGANLKGASFMPRANTQGRPRLATQSFDWCDNDDCTGRTFENVDFSYSDLRGVKFSGATFVNANFRGANLAGVDFDNASLQGAVFDEASMPGVNFHYAHLAGATFGTSYAAGADFTGAELMNTRFINASVVNSSFRGAVWTGASFLNACAWGTYTTWRPGGPVVRLPGAYLSESVYSQRDPQADGSCPTS